MLHIWLIPLLILAALVLLGFYFIVRWTGGTGVRTDGRTVSDHPEEEPPPED